MVLGVRAAVVAGLLRFRLSVLRHHPAGAAEKYSKQGMWGGDTPNFSKDTWIQHNINSNEQLPFPDKFFDFCVRIN